MGKAIIYHVGGLEDLQAMDKTSLDNLKVWEVINNYECEGDIAKALWESDSMGISAIEKSKKWNHLIVMAGADVFIVEVSE